VVVLAPTHHIYGLIWGVLLPLVLNVHVVGADLDCLSEFQSGDLVVAVPDQWAYLAESTRAWPAGVRGIFSTAPLAEAVHRKLTEKSAAGQAAPLARLLQIYGSSETAGLAWRD
jgi:4-coumarate--CoA ligase